MIFAIRSVRKILLWITCLLVLIITQITVARATPETTVKVEPYASTAQVGESFTINITLTDVQNLYGVEVNLYWNASILTMMGADIRLGVESHPDGVLHEPIFIAKNETIQELGKYLLAGTSTDPAAPFNGNGNIVRITFNVTNVGGCKLDLETELADWPPPDRDPRISWPIEHITIDGFFDLTPPTIGIPTRTPGGDVLPEQAVIVSVNVTDAVSGVKNVTLFYTINNGSAWEYLTMNDNSSTGIYEATIPAQLAGTWVKYKIIAYDYAENQATRDGTEPYCIYRVIPEIPQIIILPLFMVLTMLAVVFTKKRLPRNKRRTYH